ncbi:MAG TPA: response regulator [Chloroflexia bacterium]|nr:response regulator [Chloroflexia bacterium]
MESPTDAVAPRGGSLLVVDDDRANRLLLTRYITQQHHRVTTAENGRAALERIAQEPFDLVLLDVIMPEMDGYAVLEQLRADNRLRDLPVIMISALDEIDSVVRCIELGAADYLAKPFNPILLRARIGACLEKKRLRDQELLYLREVAQLTTAAAAVESWTFDPAALDETAARGDELGQLARVFQRMACEVIAREQRLQREVQELRIEIDRARGARQVAEITESALFRDLQEKARSLRSQRRLGGDPE